MMENFLMCVICAVGMSAFAVVHEFSPEFAKIYNEAQRSEVKHAQRYGAKAKVIYHVVDDDGRPLENVQVGYRWQNDYPRKTWGGYAMTDTDGVVVLQDNVGSQIMVSVSRERYYGAWDKLLFFWREGVSPLVKDGKWQPYGENRTIVLKRVKKPVEMKFHSWGIDGYCAPVTNVWVGLDLECGQWCKPYGAGKHEDVLVRFSGIVKDRFARDTLAEFSFTNVPYAGFYVLQKDSASSMETCYEASTNDAMYIDNKFFFKSKTAKGMPKGEKEFVHLESGKYMVFRTRCTVDESGKLISANYGKICGALYGGMMKLLFHGDGSGIYFNPTPNDPNLEDAQNVRRLKSQ